jgi:hypothetical protein
MVEGLSSSRWTPQEDDLFRTMAEANIRPELIAAKLQQISPRRQGARLRDRASAKMV